MRRRAITDKDLQCFVKILTEWEINSHGSLSWQSYIDFIESTIGYSYERTTLYKAKGGEIFRAFQLAKNRLRVSGSPRGRGSTMPRQYLLKAYAKQVIEIERLHEENKNLLRLHVKYLKLMFDNDIFPEVS